MSYTILLISVISIFALFGLLGWVVWGLNLLVNFNKETDDE